MKSDKHKKKDFFNSRHDHWDDHRVKYPKPNNIQDEDERDELPSKAPSSAVYGGRHYSNALLRLIRSHIGKRWDDVYSELAEKLGHEKDDLKWYISFDAYKREDGTIVSIGRWGEAEVRGFYVLNGVLGEQKKSYKWKRDTSKVYITFVEGSVVFKHNELFFKAPVDKALSGPMHTGWYYYTNNSSYERGETFVKFPMMVNGKNEKHFIDAQHIRPLNSKEISRWELPNTEIND